MNTQKCEDNEALEFDFYLQWEWPAHIEDTLRRMLWVSLVEACEPDSEAKKHTAFLRWQIATYPEAPPAVLDFLSNLSDAALLVRIAENSKTWTVTLSRLARHESASVRAAVAESGSIPFDVMKSLAEDECADVCYAMAENPTLPSKYLRQLLENENAYVASRAHRTLARRTPRTPAQLPLLYQQTRKAE